jgi:cell division protein FtsQ
MPAPHGLFWRGRSGGRRSRIGRRGGKLRRLASFALAVVLMSLVALGVTQLLTTFSRSERFRVRALAFSRASEALRSRLQSRLEGLVGANLFEIDLARAARLLERDPWVRRAVVKRWLPGTLQVTIEERRPAAIGLFRGREVLVDSEGWPIEERRGEPGDLPLLTGITARDPETFSRQAAAGLAALARLARQAPSLLAGLESVDLSVKGAVAIRRGGGRPEIWLSRHDAERNLANYRRIQADVERRFGPLDVVDLRWRDQIALRPGNPSGSSEGVR